MFPLRDSEKVFEVLARVRRKGVHRVEMTRWYAEKPQGLTGTSAPACPLGVSVESRVAGFGFGRVRVQDAILAIPMTANHDSARPMGSPGGSSG